ncbi:MAG: class I poly(R)-hydroxyalkanoic acid synthase [Casimicrobiaceae bacterium]
MQPAADIAAADADSPALHWQRAAQLWAGFWTRTLPQSAALESVGADSPGERAQRYAAQIAALWNAAASSAGGRIDEIAPGQPEDRRFAAPEWRTLAYFSWLRQAWLIHAAYVRDCVKSLSIPAADKRRAEFAAAQYLDAIAPSNFIGSNPAVLQRAVASHGASVAQGNANLVADIGRGRITRSDPDAFEVGRNLAMTPGSVVYRNELIELLQFDATTPKVGKRPLVIVPPCINKYYILDLSRDNSFVRHAVDAGHTTFIVSWRNIPAALGTLTWDDYLQQGVLQAIEAAKAISASATVNALGFCVGGTLLASALAVLGARNDRSVASLTLLATMLDFADPGEIGVYLSPQLLAPHEAAFAQGERMRGGLLAGAFSSLRANDLVWNYIVGNYLEGRTPKAFDLLHWNGDSANLPGPMYLYYMREMYLHNRLREHDALVMLGEPVDLARVDCPAYVFATHDDHIVPWKSAWRSIKLLGGKAAFVLGASGHIAGVVNPPQAGRRNYWTGAVQAGNADAWLAHAKRVDGSWWPHWSAWLAAHRGGMRTAPRRTGNERLPALAAAPGTYVSERVD